ncbi:ssDNA-binding domain-containing protein [Fictibacillus sp. KIGAM418]|uniref:SsDNA-binding domain-containing protein n=1 Tax=Fictibacillus marinisediminis TaxID=2878389 RepID=A0A9X1XF66_9BACL|nr:ArdC family protein [Fictibacillus marinisediminis]MCK6259566.1 ssDNA-binding domain-containing protein [Fictibacillus marinisediminis]
MDKSMPKRNWKKSCPTIEEKLKQLQQTLEDGVKNFSYSPEHFKAILEMKALMPSYSFKNMLVAKAQLPHASFLASYSRWQELGRNVVKGEKAIRIFKPIFGSNKNKDPKEDVLESDEEIKLVGFCPIPVFDFSQTEGESLPIDQIKIELVGDCSEAREIIEMVHEVADCPISYGNTGSANGYYMPGTHEIVVSDKVSINQRAKTLVHEYVHSQVHRLGNMSTSKEREVVAEGTAFIVCSFFGLDTSSYSFEYVKGWSQGDGDALLNYGSQIFDITKTIIERFRERDGSKDNELLMAV